MSTDPEARRAIAQRAIDRAKARGTPIDTDPAFLALLEEWIGGEINMKAIRERYLERIALQAAERRGSRNSLSGINPSESSYEVTEEQKRAGVKRLLKSA